MRALGLLGVLLMFVLAPLFILFFLVVVFMLVFRRWLRANLQITTHNPRPWRDDDPSASPPFGADFSSGQSDAFSSATGAIVDGVVVSNSDSNASAAHATPLLSDSVSGGPVLAESESFSPSDFSSSSSDTSSYSSDSGTSSSCGSSSSSD